MNLTNIVSVLLAVHSVQCLTLDTKPSNSSPLLDLPQSTGGAELEFGKRAVAEGNAASGVAPGSENRESATGSSQQQRGGSKEAGSGELIPKNAGTSGLDPEVVGQVPGVRQKGGLKVLEPIPYTTLEDYYTYASKGKFYRARKAVRSQVTVFNGKIQSQKQSVQHKIVTKAVQGMKNNYAKNVERQRSKNSKMSLYQRTRTWEFSKDRFGIVHKVPRKTAIDFTPIQLIDNTGPTPVTLNGDY